MLLITTIVWGASFALAKESGAAINAAAGGTHAVGPIAVLAMRFTLGAIVVAAFSIATRPSLWHAPVGWTRERLRQGETIGGLLAVSTIVQHLALDRTTEATAAFLTSLTVVFVPLILWIAFGTRPGVAAWVGVALAVPGVWLMSGADGVASFGTGEMLGVACAVGFAWHLLAVGRYAGPLGTLRACLAQFATVAIVCWPLTILLWAMADPFDAGVLLRPVVWGNVLLLVAGPTLVSFGLMAAFQPHVPPVRAALIYLLEPLFAAAFAWLWTGRPMTRGEWIGGAIILVANAIVEFAPKKSVVSSQ